MKTSYALIAAVIIALAGWFCTAADAAPANKTTPAVATSKVAPMPSDAVPECNAIPGMYPVSGHPGYWTLLSPEQQAKNAIEATKPKPVPKPVVKPVYQVYVLTAEEQQKIAAARQAWINSAAASTIGVKYEGFNEKRRAAYTSLTGQANDNLGDAERSNRARFIAATGAGAVAKNPDVMLKLVVREEIDAANKAGNGKKAQALRQFYAKM